jgi:hypothetical protein
VSGTARTSDCPCPSFFKDVAYCGDCPYRDDAEIAFQVVERDAADTGERISLDELLAEFGEDAR